MKLAKLYILFVLICQSFFAYAQVPTVTNVSPDMGPEEGGTVVTISGTNFTPEATIKFGTADVMVQSFTNPNTLQAVAPPGTGTVDVTVTTVDGTSATNPADLFTYIANFPEVLSVLPSAGPLQGGYTVRITGRNFTGATNVTFDALVSPSFTVDSNTQITATVPTSPIDQTVNVFVTTPVGTSSATSRSRFDYIDGIPLITAISPTSGFIGDTVTITGLNFLSAISVTFDNIQAEFTVDSDNQITAIAPPHGIGTVRIIVENALGPSPESFADKFTYIADPLPPIKFRGCQFLKEECGGKVNRINHLTWCAPSGGGQIIAYQIYRKFNKKTQTLSKLIATIGTDQKLEFNDRDREKGKTYTYFLISVGNDDNRSTPPVKLKVRPCDRCR